ncbi:hypothetical protein EXE10_20355 [Acinetobacter sp. WCHAc060033]|jgi:hypothetical protein|uniref:hypothetical protein n=1 Tax=Acinetobacter sp. WCHAc060033 TaxID=2518624 RepID=UPI001022BDFD|nr:hypothetical protein [Acinetobacter sp. WCHAc060033]RZG75306.1 hypothetical protein EXE10_20355 [Acinetobacter sp. WCHAc060033]
MNIYRGLNERILKLSCILIILIIVFFTISKLFSDSNVSLIKDLMGIASTIFAALIAVYIFQEWTVQKRLEALSHNSKERIPEIPNLSLELTTFSSLIDDLLNRIEIYKNSPNSIAFDNMQKLSEKLYDHPFLTLIMSFDSYFHEIKELILEDDKKLYEDLSKDMKSYKHLIFKDKVLDVNISANRNISDLIEKTNSLHKKTYDDLLKFYNRLIDYKNFNY